MSKTRKDPTPDVVPIEPAAADEIAIAIRKISDSVKTLMESQLKRKTLVVLIAYSSGVNQAMVNKVLDSLITLEAEYCK